MRLKVLHLIDSFESGGTERQAIQLVRLLHESGRCEVRLACLQNRGLLRAQVDRPEFGEIVEYPLTSFYDMNFVKQVEKLRRYLQKEEVEVIHTHCFYTNVFGMTAASLAQTSARVTYKGETDFRTSMQKRAERVAFRLAHRVVANSDAVRARLIAEGVPAEKIVRHYNGLDMARVTVDSHVKRDQLLPVFGLPAMPTRRFVTIVANLQHPVKDYPMFLRAVARIRKEVADAAFIVAGEGDLLPEMRALARQLGVEDDVFFIGRCDRVGELLFISDVCVLSSKAEGFSNSILEYMAAARPVVATDAGGAREAIIEGETGHIVPAGDDEHMAARVIDLLRDPNRARAMGEHGRRRVLSEFSTSRHLESTLALYSELLGRESADQATQSLDQHAVRIPNSSASTPV